MTETNGHEALTNLETAVVKDIEEMAAKIVQPVTVLERVRDPDASFEQRSHTLMMESVDKITNQWVAELNHVRDNMHSIEQMVIAQAAKSKEELTKLHLLGVQAMREAERGREVALQLGRELQTMMGQTVTH
jgi:Mg2+ and Co2+ transporter CorA